MINITHEPLNSELLTAKVQQNSNGAVITFLGTTRNFTNGRKIIRLEYEAYRPMADNKMEQIVNEIKERWFIENVAIAHRLGHVAVGETSLVVAIASPHRRQCFDACQYAVNRIKQMVPIWKKEIFEGGEIWIGSQEDLQGKDNPTASSQITPV